MNTSLKTKLIGEYRKAFLHTREKGGGYGFRFYHGLRVMKYCEKFLQMDYFKKKAIDKDVLLAAAFFHDIGKVKAVNKSGEIIYTSDANQAHDTIGANIVSRYIGKYFKDETLKQIQQVIREQHKKQTTIEAKMVKDADRLDNYGFIQIWRHMTYAHQTKRNIDQILEYWFNERARKSAEQYLKKLHFPSIRKIATNRFKKLDYLLSEIKKENDGLDIK